MVRSRHTKKPLGADRDRSSWFVWPEVIRDSGGAEAPAVVALCAPLHHFVVNPNLRPFIKGVEEDRDRPSPYKVLMCTSFVYFCTQVHKCY